MYAPDPSPDRPHFSPSIPGLQIAWDNTCLRDLMKCARYYYYTHVLGYRTPSAAIELDFGIRAHDVRNGWLATLASGIHPEEATERLVDSVLSTTLDWDTGDRVRNRETLLRFAVWQADITRSDPTQTIAVEQHFCFPLWGPYTWTGHVDRIAYDVTYWVEDLKTTKSITESFWKRFRPDIQMPGYVKGTWWLTGQRPAGVKILACGLGVNHVNIERRQVTINDDDMHQWDEIISYWIGEAERCAMRQHWPMRLSECYRCPFQPVCIHPSEARMQELHANYINVTWNPLEPRSISPLPPLET